MVGVNICVLFHLLREKAEALITEYDVICSLPDKKSSFCSSFAELISPSSGMVMRFLSSALSASIEMIFFLTLLMW